MRCGATWYDSPAAHNGADVIILGAFGCGAFMNDPVILAKAYQKVVQEFAHAFKVIHFAVFCGKKDSESYTTFSAMLGW